MKREKLKIFLISFLILFIGINSFGQDKKAAIKKTEIKKSIRDIDVIVTQFKSLVDSYDIPSCKVEIEIFKNGTKINSIDFSEIDPVGGHYGLLVYNKTIRNHIIISKFGDYNGQTIIINERGETFQTIGGYVSVDNQSGLLFSIYDSDIVGFSVFDLTQDKEIFKTTDIENRPREFYKYSDNRYLFKATNDEAEEESFWKIEFELDRITQMSLTIDDLKGKELEKLSGYNEINVECE